MSIENLVEISRFYGSSPEYVLAGGGNTSWKDEDTLFVKGSGFSLADAAADSFVKMDRKTLAMIWEKTYPRSNDEREKEVLSDMMAARKTGEEQKRPSVEALLHDIIPFSFIVHLHPALVNGLCCSQNGEQAVKEIFGEDALWIPSTNPGYILSCLIRTSMSEYYEKHRKQAQFILLQNHGVFTGANTTDDVKKLYEILMSKISALIKRKPDFSDEIRISANSAIENQEARRTANSIDVIKINDIIRTLTELARSSGAAQEAGFSAFMRNSEIASFVKDRKSFYPVSSAFTPDHIVYAGSDPLFVEAASTDVIRNEWNSHAKKTGRNPKIIAVQNLGVFSAAASEKAAGLALELFKDTVKVAVYTESFSGPLFMAPEKIDFINNWEVERFRSGVSTK